ncbi:MAG: hypothetical protein PF508_16455 [Spirochaeta sp.]|jgi:hypothetical protein|nr:hypothetical protein [Spirochaeta sp.]
MAYSNPLLTKPITEEALKNHHCWENVDRVSGDPGTTEFKRTARLLQSLWRESKGLPIGSQPMKPTKDRPGRPLGSRIDLQAARESGANFLTDKVRGAAKERLANPQPHQMIDEDRLYCDLLSSMPLCFNLFGELAADLALADKAVHTWWPDTPGTVTAVEFEWSPGRSLKGEYLENRSAFDVAFILDLGDGTKGVIGVETKYHEHPVLMAPTTDAKMERYRTVADASGMFANGSQEAIIGTELQQIWLDHLLALSMPQHPSGEWAWAKFILVYPSRNPSFAQVASEYQRLLSSQDTFGVSTVEELLDAGVLPAELTAAFRERYIW